MKQEILLGVTDRTVTVFIPDPASTDGSGKTGLAAADLTVSYTRVETDNDVTVTDVTSSLSDLSALTDAHSDWGLKEVSSTLAPGLYRLDIADAVFAAGAWSAVVYVMITTSAAAASPMEFILVATNHLDGVRMGLTALPNAAADAAGGLIISDAGGLDADAQRSDVAAILVDTGTTLDGKIDTIDNLIDTEVSAIITTLGTPAGASVSADIAAVKAETASILTDTAEIGSAGAGLSAVPWNASWDAEVQSEVTDALSTALTEAYATLGSTASVAQLLYEIRALLAEKSVSSTTLTTKKLDGSTTAATYTLNDATAPTQITRAS